jgi:hypothetical protein
LSGCMCIGTLTDPFLPFRSTLRVPGLPRQGHPKGHRGLSCPQHLLGHPKGRSACLTSDDRAGDWHASTGIVTTNVAPCGAELGQHGPTDCSAKLLALAKGSLTVAWCDAQSYECDHQKSSILAASASMGTCSHPEPMACLLKMRSLQRLRHNNVIIKAHSSVWEYQVFPDVDFRQHGRCQMR